MIKIYGIKNCDTVKKALKWFNENNLEYQFFDYKKDGVDKVVLKRFIEKFGLEKLINKKGTTWKKLSLEDQEKAAQKEFAIQLMIDNSSMIKRPIIDQDSTQLIGFNELEYNKVILCKSSF